MIYHNGRWLSEPEIKALINKLEEENESLKQEKTEAKRLLKAAVEDFRTVGYMFEDSYGHCTANISCDECVLGGGNLADACQWRYEAEAKKLLKGENDNA